MTITAVTRGPEGGSSSSVRTQCPIEILQPLTNREFSCAIISSKFSKLSHTCDHHVGFLSPQSGTRKHNKMSQNFSFSSYHNTKLQLSDMKIGIHTLGWNLNSCYEVKLKITVCFVVFPHAAVQKGNPEWDKIMHVSQSLYTWFIKILQCKTL